MRGQRSHSIRDKAHVRPDMSLYDTPPLRDEAVLEAAIRDLESDLDNPAATVESISNRLFSNIQYLEHALSAVNDEAAQKLCDIILNNFPSDASAFAPSLAGRLLEHLSPRLLFLTSLSSADKSADLRQHCHTVQRATAVLISLSAHTFDPDFIEEQIDLDDGMTLAVRVTKQRKKRRPKQPQRKATMVNPKPFQDFGIEVPSSQEEADAVAASILDQQKQMLQFYLDAFRDPALRDAFQQACTPIEPPVEKELLSSNHTSDAQVEAIFTTDSIPAAYPMVQPMKAALYFDSADGFGEWRILISTRADADLRQTRRKNPALFDITLNKIRALSNGHFSYDNQKPLTDDSAIPIYEAKMTGDSRLVYQIDCVPEYQSDVERQVIKVFGIYTHAHLNRRFWDGMGQQLARKGKQYRERCIFRNRPVKVGNHAHTILPALFPAPIEAPSMSPSSGLPDLHKDDLQKMHEMLVLEKYVTFSQALLNSILADQDVLHVFDVSPQEKQIIEHPASCYVLGRSGTGKTTTMLFKMLGIERAWQAHEGVLAKPRQVFVTQSRVLAEKVQEYFKKLHESLSTADKSPEELKDTMSTKQTQQAQGLVDLDEEIERSGDLPKRYGELTDEHFPMFITFDQLCRLLEQELASSARKVQQNPMHLDIDAGESEAGSNDYIQQHRVAFVSYGVFLESYWAHFPQPLTKGLDPALVFGEIMGVIKGSERTLGSPKGYLGRETYIGLSHRTQGTFASQRETIYKLFEAYLRRKRERRDYDAADRTHALLSALRQHGVPGKHVDFLYIDEAQDNLLIDALVLRSTCSNAETGLFWGGDTAQTISIGSAFRFDDLKAFLYRVENAGESSPKPGLHPEAFQLAVNYRSHAGIVNCARSAIELITKFWPHAIDHLGEEHGIVDGLKPVFFSGWDEDSVRYEQFLFGDSGSHIEFGAQQCILVRDDAARDKLRAQVGNIGLIMTLYESKGLEFNDVLLYNFFSDSTVDLSQWRVVLNALPQGSGTTYRTPRFDDSRHNGVCRELKFLYVAITRARQNLWIADNSDKGEPMRVLWTAKSQIQNCTPGTDVPRLAMSSTPEEWARTALTLFNNRRYSQAMHCYERAMLPRERAAAEAYYFREIARNTPLDQRGENTARIKAFVKAAEAFWVSGEAAVTEKLVYFRISAECYVQSGDDAKAAHAYLCAAEYTPAAQCYRRAGRFEDAVTVIKGHRDDVTESVANSIIDVSRLEFLRGRKLRQARELFETDEEALEYMDDCGLDIAQVALLEDLGRFSEAAELHLTEGRTLEAIATFLKDTGNPRAAERASRCLLDGLWRGLSLGISVNSDIVKENVIVGELLRMLHNLDVDLLDGSNRDEVLMFRAIASNNTLQLLELGERFQRWYQTNAAALLCFDHAFATLPEFQLATQLDVATGLRHFSLYVKLLQFFTFQAAPSSNADIRRLFGFTPVTGSEDFFVVPKETLLFAHCNEKLTRAVSINDEGAVVLRPQLDNLVSQFLRDRLRHKVIVENQICRQVQAFHVCLSYIAFGSCNRSNCPQMHIAAEGFNLELYNLRVRICLQQILIYHTVYVVEDYHEQGRQRRYWLRLLHEALEPPYYKLGSLHNLQPALIPEFLEAIQAVKTWTIDWLYTVHPRPGILIPTFLTSLLRSISLGLAFDRGVIEAHIPRSIAYTQNRNPALLRQTGDNKAYVVHDMCRLLLNNHRASLPSGILFIRHILVERVDIDVGVLCNLIDHLCTLLIVASRLQHRHTLHDLTLPRSWLQQVMGDLSALHERELIPFYPFTQPMTDLLARMYTGIHAEHLLFERRDLSTLGRQVRSIFIARVCKTLCLLAYNSPYLSLRREVHQIVTSLRKFDTRFDRSFERYVMAPSWDALAREVRQNSVSGSLLDEMIHFQEASRTSPHSMPFSNVRRVVYNNIEELPALLASGLSVLPKFTLRGDAAPFIPTQKQNALPETTPSDIQHTKSEASAIPHEESEEPPKEPQNEDDDIEGQDGEHDIDMENLNLNIDDERTAPAQAIEEEIRAAKIIRNVYLRYRRHRQQSGNPSAIHSIRLRVIDSFRVAAKDIEWPTYHPSPRDPSYQKLFLGPLPHAFLCLECARHYVHETKRLARNRLVDAVHFELEEVSGRMTKCSRHMKEVTRLIKALEPTAELHKKRDRDELKRLIREVEQFAGSLPVNAVVEWQEDLERAVKGIVKPNPPPAKKPKPELNMEDHMVDYEEVHQ